MQEKWTDGDAYEQYVGRWSRRIAERFLCWLDAPQGVRWLDLGCGTGALASQILRHCSPASVIAVEPSEEFLRLARQQVTDRRVEFRQGAAERIPVVDQSVDFLVSALVLNFLPDKSAALHDMVRSVAPGGTIAAYVWDYAGHTQFMRYFWDVAVALDPGAREKHEGIRFPICRPAPLREIFEIAGLRDVVVEAIDIVTPFKNFDDFWRPFLRNVAPAPGYCVSLDDASREKLKLGLRRALPADPDGVILLVARAWGVRGKRY